MNKTFNEMLESAKSRTEFWLQGAIVDFTEDVVQRMKEEGISRAQLAEKINAKPAYITKILKGNTNFTLETMVKVGRALNSQVRIHLQREDCLAEWIDFLKNEPVVSSPSALPDVWNDSDFQADKKVMKFENESLAAAA